MYWHALVVVLRRVRNCLCIIIIIIIILSRYPFIGY